MTDIAHITERSVEELRANVAIRRALEDAARAIERLAGTRHYQAAFKKAAHAVRALKPD